MTTDWHKMKTGHVGLNVTDLDRSIAFYQAVLSLDLIGRSDGSDQEWAFLGSEGALLVTLWVQSEGRFASDRPGLHHLAFEVPSMEMVKQIEGRARAAGAEIYHDGVVAHREGASSGGLFFSDPDGIRLEVSTKTGAAGSPAPSGAAPTCGFF